MLDDNDRAILQRPFAKAEHEFKGGFAYVKEESIVARIEEVDGSFDWHLSGPVEFYGNDAIAIGQMTIKGVRRDGVGMAPLTLTDSQSGEVKPAQAEPAKSAATDAFKRASRLFGVGRYLLSAPKERTFDRFLADTQNAWMASHPELMERFPEFAARMTAKKKALPAPPPAAAPPPSPAVVGTITPAAPREVPAGPKANGTSAGLGWEQGFEAFMLWMADSFELTSDQGLRLLGKKDWRKDFVTPKQASAALVQAAVQRQAAVCSNEVLYHAIPDERGGGLKVIEFRTPIGSLRLFGGREVLTSHVGAEYAALNGLAGWELDKSYRIDRVRIAWQQRDGYRQIASIGIPVGEPASELDGPP